MSPQNIIAHQPDAAPSLETLLVRSLIAEATKLALTSGQDTARGSISVRVMTLARLAGEHFGTEIPAPLALQVAA